LDKLDHSSHSSPARVKLCPAQPTVIAFCKKGQGKG